jgi:hypothetical protein
MFVDGDSPRMDAQLLADDLADQIVTTARTATGDSLRSVTYFTRSDFEQLYLREDLERDADLDTFVGHEWRGFRDTRNAYQTSELGEYRYTVRAFENGYLLRVTGERAGVLITTDGLYIQSYEDIADAIEKMLAEDPTHN